MKKALQIRLTLPSRQFPLKLTQTPNPKPQTPNPKPQTPNPKFKTYNLSKEINFKSA
jgi:hypothetical protein